MSADRRKYFFFWAVIIGFVVATIELGSYAAIHFLNPHLSQEIRRTRDIYHEQSSQIRRYFAVRDTVRDVLDSLLGLKYRLDYHGHGYDITSQGLRGFHKYTATARPGVLRMAAYGDSFVFGAEVSTADAWPTLLEADGETFEVLNYGVGGYGTDQALLRYRLEGETFAPHVVLIGFFPVNIGRNVNVYRRFLHNREGILTKPRFLLNERGELELLPNPIRQPDDWKRFLDEPKLIRQLGTHDQWYRPSIYENPLYDYSATIRLFTFALDRLGEQYFRPDRLLRGGLFNPTSKAFELQTTLLETFVAEVKNAGATPIILVFPGSNSILNSLNGDDPVFLPLIDHFRTHKLEYLDITDAFRAAAEDAKDLDTMRWFEPGGHYSPIGNRVVASWLDAKLRDRFDLPTPTQAKTGATPPSVADST